MSRWAMILALAGGAWAASAPRRAEVVVVRGTTTARQRPSEARGVPRWARSVTEAARAAGLEVDELTDQAVERGALRGRRLAIFSFNGTMEPKEIEQVQAFIAAGGKVIYFASLPSSLQKALGFTARSSRRVKYPGECEWVKLDPAALKGAPAKMRQATWNFNVQDPGPGGRVLGTWMDGEGKDTKISAVAANERAMWMGHVLTGADPAANAQFVLAAVGHFVPDAWAASVGRALGQRGHWGAYRSLDDLRAAARARLAGKARDAALATLDEGAALRKQAEQLLADQRFPEALAASRAALAKADLAYCMLQPSREGEFRGIWMHPSIVKDDWDGALRACAQAGLNAVVPVVAGGYYASYDSKLLPRRAGTEDQPDQLTACIKAARKHGLEVHAWRVNWSARSMRPEEFEQLKAAGRLQVDFKGQVQRWLCPSSEANQKLELDAMVEMATRYPVDGIHFDYIRYPNDTTCYCERCRKQFAARLGRAVEGWPLSAYRGPLKDEYREFRRSLITRLVAAVHREARKARPDIVISAAVFRNWEKHRHSVGQDWKLWVERGTIDLVCPMDYTASTERFAREVRSQVGWVNSLLPLAPGIGVSSSGSKMTAPGHLAEQIEAARRVGADGFTLFCYRPSVADALFPGLRAGAAARPTYTGVGGPAVRFILPEPPRRERGERLYPAGKPLAAGVALRPVLPGGRRARRIHGAVWLETALGRRVKRLATFDATDDHTLALPLALGPGRHRLAVLGTAELTDGKARRFARRGPLMVVLTAAERSALEAELHPSPPRFAGKGLRVGVFAVGFGSQSILAALREMKGVEAQPAKGVTAAMLAPCQLLVLPQIKGRGFAAAELAALRAWVRAGGRVALTHDAVGYRDHEPPFPQVARGVGQARDAKVECPPLAERGWRRPPGGPFATTYYDVVTMAAGPAGKVAARVAGGKAQAAAVLGVVGKGRVFATGIAIGLGPDNADAAPTAGELALLRAALGWLRE